MPNKETVSDVIRDANLQPMRGGKVIVTLNGSDIFDDGVRNITQKVVATTDKTGAWSMELIVNAEGENAATTWAIEGCSSHRPCRSFWAIWKTPVQITPRRRGRVHRAMSPHIQAGELRAWAISETEARRVWNLLPENALRSGDTITISFRDDETLTTETGRYAAYGGDPDDLGLQVSGGGSITSACVSGSDIVLEVNGTVTGVRYAFQRDDTTDWRDHIDANGCGYVRNRGLIARP